MKDPLNTSLHMLAGGLLPPEIMEAEDVHFYSATSDEDQDPLALDLPDVIDIDSSSSGSESNIRTTDTSSGDALAVHSPTSVMRATAATRAQQSMAYMCERLYVCRVDSCLKTFLNKRKYQDHRVKLHNLPRYECNTCYSAFTSYHKLVSHMEDKMHFISCQFCNVLCASPSLSSYHFSNHHKLTVCVICNERFYGSVAFKKHEKDCRAIFLGSDLISATSSLMTATSSTTTATSSATVNSTDCLLHHDYAKPRQLEMPAPTFHHNYAKPTQLEMPAPTFHHNYAKPRQLEMPAPTFHHNYAKPRQLEMPASTFHRNHAKPRQLEIPVPALWQQSSGGISMIENSFSQPVLDSMVVENIDNSRTTSSHPVPKSTHTPQENDCLVIFGPGASELLDSPESSSQNHTQPEEADYLLERDSNIQAEPAKQPAKRYLCKYCLSKFSSKMFLKKHHKKKHSFLCHCGEKFMKKFDLMKHKRIHKQVVKKFLCSICNFKVSDLHHLLVHEMRHRLKSNYKLKVEKENGKGRSKCSKCEKKFTGTSPLIHHEVWHEWDRIWNSYVTAKVFRLKTNEEQIRRMEDNVKCEIEHTWKRFMGDNNKDVPTRYAKTVSQKINGKISNRCCKKRPQNTSLGITESQKASTSNASKEPGDLSEKTSYATSSSENVRNKSGDLNKKTSCAKSSSKTSEDDKKLYEWMSYWRSYIGLSDADPVPSWIQPILDILHSKFKYFNINYQEDLFRKMDQVAFLVRAQRNEESHLGGARVVVERLSPSIHKPQHEKLACTPKADSMQGTIVLSEGVIKLSGLQESESQRTHRKTLTNRPCSSQTAESPGHPMLSPVVLLNRYVLPFHRPTTENRLKKPSKLPEAAKQVQEWLKEHSADLPFPQWVWQLIKHILNEPSFSQGHLKSKLDQISHLIKAERSSEPLKTSLSKVRLSRI